jgi:hypothetical protein
MQADEKRLQKVSTTTSKLLSERREMLSLLMHLHERAMQGRMPSTQLLGRFWKPIYEKLKAIRVKLTLERILESALPSFWAKVRLQPHLVSQPQY